MHGTTTMRVTAPDGVATTAECTGPANARPIVFIHGMLHSRLVWRRQFEDPQLAAFRLIAYDVRGHGDADKPTDAAFYDSNRRFADELQAVLTAAQAERPVLVGWSLGSRIVFGYLETCGWNGLGGIVITGARMKANIAGTARNPLLADVDAADLETRIAARLAMIDACHAAPLPPDDRLSLLAQAMVVPPAVMTHIAGRPLDQERLMTRLPIPIRMIHGDQDRLCAPALAQASAKLNPRTWWTLYKNTGHAPFFERPDRFNRDLAEFMQSLA